MGSQDGLEELLQAGVFMVLLRVGGALAAPFYATLLGELLVGTFLGPHGLDIIPHVAAVRLIGEVALCMLVFEGGLAVDLTKVRSIGCIAIAIALTGTFLPLLIGWGLLIAMGYGTKEGLAAGTALSSTSIGMATRLLQDNNSLETREGLLISVAAIVDDIASLVILAVLGSLSGDNPSAWAFSRPIVASAGAALATPILLWLFPRFVSCSDDTVCWLSKNIGWVGNGGGGSAGSNLISQQNNDPQSKLDLKLEMRQQEQQLQLEGELDGGSLADPEPLEVQDLDLGALEAKSIPKEGSVPLPDEAPVGEKTGGSLSSGGKEAVKLVRIVITSGFLIGMVAATGYAGTTPLLGAFIAGITSSKVPRLRELWENEVGTISAAMTSVFFASIGTYVPLKQMFHPRALGLGLLYTTAAVVGKWVTGLLAWSEGGWVTANVIGWAMVGRGELGFMMAASALSIGLLSEETFAITVWALLLATLASPILFRRCLEWNERVRISREIKARSLNEEKRKPVSEKM